MTPNSRGLCWLKKANGHRAHAFYISSAGVASRQSICNEWFFDESLVPAHVREEAPCRHSADC